MNFLSVEDISKSYGERTLFSGISFGINKEQKIAFVARNGTGKTTLLHILAGIESPDTGMVTYRKDLRKAFLKQDPDLEHDLTVEEAVFDPNNPVVKALHAYEMALATNASDQEVQAALDRVEHLNGWDFEVRAKQILSKLALTRLDQRVGTLSGGQRKRVALARVLIEEPEFLVMDEPTNHLDLDMIEWLEGYLSASGCTLFMVTHDRYFLENVCTEIIELEGGQLHRYRGNYGYFLEKKAEREAVEAAGVEKAKNLMRKELDWMRRMPKARGTKSKARIDAFYDLKAKASSAHKEGQVNLEINIQRLGGKVLEMHHLRKQYGERPLIEDFSYKFIPREKVGIVGPNGAGKTTLLNLIMGLDEPDGGKVVQGETVQFGYYSQEGITLKDEKRVIEVVRDVAEVIPLTKGKKITAAQLLERFLFPRSMHYNYVSKLSGGEKRRLYLLSILMKNPNFIILDEPTNDLDILTLNVLEEFLEDFPGCLLIVTHDRYFMDKLVDHLFVFQEGGTIKDFPGNYTQYRVWAQQQEAKRPTTASTPKKEKAKPKEKTRLSYNEKREFEQLTKDLDRLEARKEELTSALSSGTLDNQELQDTAKELGAITEELDEMELRWLELSEYAE